MHREPLPAILQQFAEVYRHIDADTPARMAALYAEAVVFRDPVHEIHGLAAVQAYTAALGRRVLECGFDCRHWLVDGEQAAVQWQMHLRHPALQGGRPLTVRGMSHLRFGHRISFHEDFYDLGALIYEQVPVLGGSVRWLRRRLARAVPA